MSEQYLQPKVRSSGAVDADDDSVEHCDRAEAYSALRRFFAGYDELFVLTGPADVGKTRITAELLSELDAGTPLILFDAAVPDECGLMNSVCSQLGVEALSADWEETLDLLTKRLSPHAHAFLIIDNAHEMGESDFEELRLLSYLRCGRGPQLQVILVGHERLLGRVQSSDMAQRGLWHYQTATLSALTDSKAPYSRRVGAAPGAGPRVKPIAASTLTRLPLRTHTVPPDEVKPRGELAQLVPREKLIAETGSDYLEADQLPVPTVVYVGEVEAQQRRPFWRRSSTLVLMVSPILLAGVYWLGYSQAREPVVEAKVAAEPATPGPSPAAASPSTVIQLPEEPQAPAPSVVSQQPLPTGQLVVPPFIDMAAPSSVMESPAVTAAPSETAPTTAGDAAQVAVLQDEPPVVESVDSLADEIDGLLAAAAEAMSRDYLRTPAEISAWNYFTQVLALQPENAAAQRGMRDIADRYEVLSRLAIERGKFRSAQTYINRGLGMAAGHDGLLAKQGELDSAKAAAEEARLREEQARMAAAEAETVSAAQEEDAVEKPRGFMGLLKNIFTSEDQQPGR
ncbi:AAA family ATPase [Pseudohalioglobus lutimaris]|uniref:ORC1/DEAH AAA+ ATPase domain-containing protein n=1 Tax=Pseudohalioglobus lutimaris TaxID=1737061 RepID=A0A2N5X8A7_9GAMM|nr:AAA family ATPase [Pseudohalioglobus lutimaris]PLW70734.1 hypothetical protein C0039_00965 [Pseudohalioglobus lutimaris]